MTVPSLESRLPLFRHAMVMRCARTVSSFLARRRGNTRALRWLRELERALADLEEPHRLEVLHLLARHKR